jgi:osmotically inducible protein OsmC
MKSNASAIWQGTGKEGSGTISANSGVLKNVPYSYTTRFVSGPGTNPEELIAAAHASCFSMKCAFLFAGAGFPVDKLETNCEVTLDNGAVTSSHLKMKASIKTITREAFDKIADEASKTCPISKLLNTAITLEATLE